MWGREALNPSILEVELKCVFRGAWVYGVRRRGRLGVELSLVSVVRFSNLCLTFMSVVCHGLTYLSVESLVLIC